MIRLDKVDFSGLNRKLREISRITKEEPAALMKQEARLLCVELSKYTQPFGVDDKGREKGESAMRGDLLGTRAKSGATKGSGDGTGGVFTVMADTLIANATQEKSGNVRLFAKKDGTVYGTDQAHFRLNPSMAELAAHHKSLRRDDGTVTTAGYRTRDIGRWKFIQKLVISRTVFEKYFETVKKKVGIAKSGWADCAKQLGGTRGIPGWVTRHLKDFSFGRVEDKTSAPSPSIRITNTINFTSQVLSASGVKEALRDREIKLTSRLKKIMAAKLKAV